MGSTPTRALRFTYRPTGADPATTVYVDGTEPGYRSLSHWPGHSTPAALRHDLSTGIALEFASRTPDEQLALVGPFEQVAQNHFDTDGVLSVFSILRPDEALPRRPALLAAAATGDFATWNGPEALAVELTVMHVTKAPQGPLAARLPAGAADEERWAAGYDWLVEQLPAILDEPFAWRTLWAARHDRIAGEVDAIGRGELVAVERRPEHDFAVVTCERPLSAIGLHHAAGPLYRVLLVSPCAGGHRYRFCYRDESWFDTVTIRAAPRRPLERAVDELLRAEGGGALVEHRARRTDRAARLRRSRPAGQPVRRSRPPRPAPEPPAAGARRRGAARRLRGLSGPTARRCGRRPGRAPCEVRTADRRS